VEKQHGIAFACVSQAQAAYTSRLDTNKENSCPPPKNSVAPLRNTRRFTLPLPLLFLSIRPPRVLIPWSRSLVPPSQPPRKFLPCPRRPCLPFLVLLVATAQVLKNLRLASSTSWIVIIVKDLSSLIPTVCPPISRTSYIVISFADPNFAPSATSRIVLVNTTITNVLDVGSIHEICVFRKTIMWSVLNATLLYATTTSRNEPLTLKTVNIRIVNTSGYIVSEIVVNVVPIHIVLLVLEKNASPVV
jgi:hypothetical protein